MSIYQYGLREVTQCVKTVKSNFGLSLIIIQRDFTLSNAFRRVCLQMRHLESPLFGDSLDRTSTLDFQVLTSEFSIDVIEIGHPI